MTFLTTSETANELFLLGLLSVLEHASIVFPCSKIKRIYGPKLSMDGTTLFTCEFSMEFRGVVPSLFSKSVGLSSLETELDESDIVAGIHFDLKMN